MALSPMRAIHPGEILQEEFLELLGMSVNALARTLRIPPSRLHEIVHGRRSISPDTALRLARYFGTTAEFWMNLQVQYDLRREQAAHGDAIERDIPETFNDATYP